MKLKIKERSALVLPYTMKCGMIVNVRRLSMTQRRELDDSVRRADFNPTLGRIDREVDPKLATEKYPDAFIAGWSNFKPEMLLQMNIEVEEMPPLDADGCIPYDQELARQLWDQAIGFAGEIYRFQDIMLVAADAAKKNASIISNGS